MPVFDESFEKILETIRPWKVFDKHGILSKAEEEVKSKYRYILLGEFSAGKSTLINALAKDELCEIGINPTTEVPKVVQLSWAPDVEVVDLPGINAGNLEEHEAIAMAEMGNANMVILVLKATQPITEKEVLIFQKILKGRPEIAVVVNWWNVLLIDKDKEDCMHRVRTSVEGLLPGATVSIFRVDAAEAMANGKDPFDFCKLEQFVQEHATKSGASLNLKKLDTLCSCATEALRQIEQDQAQNKAALKEDHAEKVRQLELSLHAEHESFKTQINKITQEFKRVETEIQNEKEIFYQSKQLYENKVTYAEQQYHDAEDAHKNCNGGALDGCIRGLQAGSVGGGWKGATCGALLGILAGGYKGSEDKDALDRSMCSKKARFEAAKEERDEKASQHDARMTSLADDKKALQIKQDGLQDQHQRKNCDIQGQIDGKQKQMKNVDKELVDIKHKLHASMKELGCIQKVLMHHGSSVWSRPRSRSRSRSKRGS